MPPRSLPNSSQLLKGRINMALREPCSPTPTQPQSRSPEAIPPPIHIHNTIIRNMRHFISARFSITTPLRFCLPYRPPVCPCTKAPPCHASLGRIADPSTSMLLRSSPLRFKPRHLTQHALTRLIFLLKKKYLRCIPGSLSLLEA